MAEDDFFPSLADLAAEDVDVDDESLADVQQLSLDDDPFDLEISTTPLPYGFTWAFDFSEGDLALDRERQYKIITDYATLRDWIGHTLNTERFETTIYGGDIGTTINSLLGSVNTVDPVAIGRVEREIVEAISVHDRIDKVHEATSIAIGEDLFVYVKYTTDDQTVQETVVGL